MLKLARQLSPVVLFLVLSVTVKLMALPEAKVWNSFVPQPAPAPTDSSTISAAAGWVVVPVVVASKDPVSDPLETKVPPWYQFQPPWHPLFAHFSVRLTILSPVAATAGEGSATESDANPSATSTADAATVLLIPANPSARTLPSVHLCMRIT